MPLPIVAGKQAWKLIQRGRKALEHFRALPTDDRERLRGEADRVRALVAEHGAATATSMRSRGERPAPGETRREPQIVMAALRHAIAAISGATAHEFEALAETRRGRYAAKALRSGARRMQGDAPPEIFQEASLPRMGFFRKRGDPNPQDSDDSKVRARLERLTPELLPNERVLASAANFFPSPETPSLWVVTNRQLHEITEDDLQSILLAEIDEYAHGLRGSEFVISLAVSNPRARTWSSHTTDRLLFASQNVGDAEGLHASFGSMLGV